MSPGNEKPQSHYPTVRQAFGLAFIIVAITLGVFIAGGMLLAFLPRHLHEPGTFRSAVELLLYSLGLWLSLRFGLRRRAASVDAGRPALRFSKVPASTLVVSCLMAAALLFILDPLSQLMPAAPAQFEQWAEKATQPNLANFISMVIVAPVFEELLCRGVMLDGLLKNYRPSTAIAWSSLVFSLLHLNPWQAGPAFIIGIFLGWVYWKTRSLIPCILIHATNNLICFVVIARFGSTFTTADVLGPAAQLAVLAGAVTVLAAGAWWVARSMRSLAAMPA